MNYSKGLMTPLLVLWATPVLALPAFPGAEGFGSDAIGGRDGAVVHVTTNSDSGAGSFREAVTGGEHRIVVFDISGIINLSSPLVIDQNYLTIAGQTSPSGVVVAGHEVVVSAHDIIIQHMRFRPGSHASPSSPYHAMLVMGDVNNWYPNPAYNIVIDHCSFSWGDDEVVTVGYGAYNITFQYCLFGEGGIENASHNFGFLASGKDYNYHSSSLHHSFITQVRNRVPEVTGSPNSDVSAGGIHDARNVVVYNWYHGYTASVQQDMHANFVNFYYKKGQQSYDTRGASIDPGTYATTPPLYVSGNLSAQRTSQTEPEWDVQETYRFGDPVPDEVTYRSMTPLGSPPPVTNHLSSAAVADCIVQNSGATAPQRDAVDTLYVADYLAGTGDYLYGTTGPSYPDAWGPFTGGVTATDSDGDAMADDWELVEYGSLTQNATDDFDADGYNNIEEYLHSLSLRSFPYDPSCMPAAWAPETSVDAGSVDTSGEDGSPADASSVPDAGTEDTYVLDATRLDTVHPDTTLFDIATVVDSAAPDTMVIDSQAAWDVTSPDTLQPDRRAAADSGPQDSRQNDVTPPDTQQDRYAATDQGGLLPDSSSADRPSVSTGSGCSCSGSGKHANGAMWALALALVCRRRL